MDGRLLKAAVTGDATLMKQLASDDPAVLLGTTPQGNTCLHISAIYGHEEFCRDAMAMNGSLLNTANKDGETPLLTAVTRGQANLASSVFLSCCRETIKKQDKQGCNTLHHAIRSGYTELALDLMEAEPALSKAVNERNESPMFIAVMRGSTDDVFNKLLEVPDWAHSGALGFNVLHAAVQSGNSVMARKVLVTRPELVTEENENKHTPMHLAVSEGKVDVLTVLLEHDPGLGYLTFADGAPLLCNAASQGHVGVARELLKHCPDAPYCGANGSTCLHMAVSSGHMEFVQFVMGSQELQNLINMADSSGKTALHLAATDGKTDMVDAFLLHEDIDVTVLDNAGNQAKALILPVRHLLPRSPTPHLHPRRLSAAPPPPSLVAPAPGTPCPPSGMDQRLLEAATCGHAAELRHLALHVPGVLLGTTPRGNTCLHIASVHGHERFCEDVLFIDPSLLAATNTDDETPLLAAAATDCLSVASLLLRCCRERQLSGTILKQDKNGCNALHHAIRGGHRKLARELIEAEPALSRAVNKHKESPMFIAVMRDYVDVFEKLLKIPESAYGGACGMNALHAAVRNGNSAIAEKIMQTRPVLAREENIIGNTPVQLAALWDKVDVLRVLLEHDRSLGYLVNKKNDDSLLISAAFGGRVGVARELLQHCPDAPFSNTNGWTCLHQAVLDEQTEFVEFILGSLQLNGLVNMRDSNGETPLHIAVQKCNPKMVAALLRHQHVDVTVINNNLSPATWKLSDVSNTAKTLNWNEVMMLMLKADPQHQGSIFNLYKVAKNKVRNSSMKDIKSLTQTYTSNTSLVAILIATITFAAAFTLPGGYSTDAGNEGLPIMARKFAFQAFLISDTLAMCSSLAVAFICIIARWEDLEFLLYYRTFTKKLMWFAYVATTTAFATGLYTVLAPHLLWLATAICVLTSLLPILTKLLGEWAILRLRLRLGQPFNSELLQML